MPHLPRPPRRTHRIEQGGEDEPLEDRGRSLWLRLLALLGAFSFVMLGLSSLVPLLRPPPPPPMPDHRQGPIV